VPITIRPDGTDPTLTLGSPGFELDVVLEEHAVLIDATEAAVADALDRAHHTGTQLASTISDFTEASQDVIGAMVAAAGGSYNDGAGTISLPSGGSSVTTVQATRSSGDILLNNTGAFTANVDTGLDLSVAATAGQKIELQLHANVNSEVVICAFDFVTVSGGNFVSSGTSTPYTWGLPGSRCEASIALAVNPSTLYTVQSGDISGGNVVFRLRYKTHAASNKTLYASGGINLRVSAKNLG
jgi:hypothetical protein